MSEVKTTGNRKCYVCEEEKRTSEFRKAQIVCKICEIEDYNIECPCCGEIRNKSEFIASTKCIFGRNKDAVNKRAASPKTRECVGCRIQKQVKQFRRGKEICIECETKGVIYDKFCKTHGITHPSDQFRHNRNECIDAERESGRNYRKTTTKAAEWVENNREKMSELQHNHYISNKEKIREKESIRLKTDDAFREIKNYRTTVCCLVNGETKSNTKMEVKKREHYISWLEYRFEADMTMENHYELWQIDHIIPLDAISKKYFGEFTFPEDSNLDCLYGWYNTTPVYSDSNRKKNKYVKKDAISFQLKQLSKFLTKHPEIEKTEDYYAYRKIAQYIADH